MSKRIPFYISARAIILNGKKILMGFEPLNEVCGGDHWETPGGHIEPDESVIDGLRREIKEETGAKVKIKNILPFFFPYRSEIVRKEYKGHYGIIFFFVCETITKPDLKKATDKEFSSLKFIGKDEFRSLLKENKIMIFDRLFLPKVMKKLKKW